MKNYRITQNEGLDTTQKDFVSLVENYNAVDIKYLVMKPQLRQYSRVIAEITQKLPAKYHEIFFNSIFEIVDAGGVSSAPAKLEQELGNWEFTAEVESTPKLKKMFINSEKRGPSKKSYTLDEVFSK